ncbi:uncharacterized protein LOC110069350 [Orbicella faveolata]|uniref:uncharacterized protein LOC110069350 n=1 Tax=Orbicella faveolata TaxID=48498 RepID=UPI0009E32405|nr:uncharacterized protein LOC110069350 [Orbicella faveolata]
MTTAMSSQTLDKLTDELKQAYNAVLLQVFKDLEAEQRAELYYYFTAHISRDTLHILRSLEDAGKVSWLDVTSLKKALTEISRLDLERKVSRYEIKRNLTILLNFYAEMKLELQPCSLSKSVESVARCLLDLMTAIVRDGFDVNIVRSLTEPIKGTKKVLLDWERAIERELSYPWDRVTILVLITGEMIAEALANAGLSYTPEVLNMSSTLADMICTRMIEQGSWVS